LRRFVSSPRDSATVVHWTWSAARDLRRSLRSDGIQALGSVTPAPTVSRDHRPTVSVVLRAAGASCLVRSAVLQRWDADHGRPRELVIGVAREDEDVTAHAWLAGERHSGAYVELHRRAAP